MNKLFSDRALIISSLIIGASIITAALIISPKNPFAPIIEPIWKATIHKESFKKQFIAQMTEKIQREPKADVALDSQLQSITVESIQSGRTEVGTPAVKIDYTLHYQPKENYKFSCWAQRIIGANYYGGFAKYGYPTNESRQMTRIKIF